MKLKFDSAEVTRIRQLDDDRFGWAEVEVTLCDGETGAYPSVAISVPLAFRPNWPLSRIQQAAIAAATTVIFEAGRHLSETDD